MDFDCASCWLVASVANIIYVLISRDSFKPQLHFMTPLNILLTNPISLRSVLVQSFMECSPCSVYDPQLMHRPQNVISLKHCRTSISALWQEGSSQNCFTAPNMPLWPAMQIGSKASHGFCSCRRSTGCFREGTSNWCKPSWIAEVLMDLKKPLENQRKIKMM